MTTPFSWDFPYAWPRKPVLAANVVCTSQPLAAQAGLRMLAEGGSAADAAIATAITLTLVEPVSNGIGSDAFAIVWDGRELHGLNASGRSPAAWTPEYFGGKGVPALGWNSVTVPGAVSAWVELHAKFGKLPFERLFEPAISYGRNGFLVSPTVAEQWAAQVPLFKSQPGFAEAFMPGGRAPKPGERFSFPDHAATLEQIAATNGEAFYRGELAAKLEAHSTANGGVMQAGDLAAHRADWVKTISGTYRGYTLHEIPPNGQGIVALIALGILRAVRYVSATSRFRRQRASADRSAQARFRRRTGLCGRHRPHAGAPGTPAGQGIPEASCDTDRPEAGKAGGRRHSRMGAPCISPPPTLRE